VTAGRGDVVVVSGAGGMGVAVARRVGAGSTLVIADVDAASLTRDSALLTASGYRVVARVTDVSDRDSVAALAADAAALGSITAVVHTAGLSPVQAPADAIMRVDLLGTALMLDAFGAVVAPGSAGVFVASMAGSMASLDPDLERRLATTPTEELLGLPEVCAAADAGMAYALAKRANQLRVRAASVFWGSRGATVNSISPGVIATPMGAAELDGPNGEMMRTLVTNSGTGRI
jgi:NAD(P)-dependent dehydrogenase (short-subunit alcohol dehydrogenase family)